MGTRSGTYDLNHECASGTVLQSLILWISWWSYSGFLCYY